MDVDTVRSREQVLVTIRKKKKKQSFAGLLLCYDPKITAGSYKGVLKIKFGRFSSYDKMAVRDP